MNGQIEGFILDLDGVITETAEYHFKAWEKMADEEGISFTRKDNEKLRGVSRRKSLELILGERELPEKKMQELMARKNRYYNQFLQELSTADLLSGARELMTKIKVRGYKMAVASSSKNARTVLESLNISSLFDTISDGNSVENTKPAPDLFLHTAEMLYLDPGRCVVVEDAGSGVEAALKANMLAVGIGPEERVGQAHLRYESVKEVKLEEIINYKEN